MGGGVFFGLDGVELGTDLTAPYLADRNPSPGQIDVPRNTVLSFRIKDDALDVAESTIIVTVQRFPGAPVDLVYSYLAGWQNGYLGNISEESPSGRKEYVIQVQPFNGLWANYKTMVVGVVAQDLLGNTLNTSYDFTIADELAPVVSARAPGPGDTGVAQDAHLIFELDDDGKGVDLTTAWLRLTVGSNVWLVVDNGIVQAGFSGGFTTDGGGGYDADIIPTLIFEPGRAGLLELRVADIDGNLLDTSWLWRTEAAPVPEGWLETRGWLKAMTRAIGQSDDEIGGVRATRLREVASLGDTVLSVDGVHDWPAAGRAAVDGVVYTYSAKTAETLEGIAYLDEGVEVSGTKQQHREESMVLDISRQYSAIDLARRMLLVEYAEAGYLDVLGRNLGVLRHPEVADDDIFRAVVKALAYNPRGTVYGIQLMLDALLGAGNYEIFEDLIKHPNTVFIRIDGSAAAADVFYGKAYLEAPEYRPADTSTEITLAQAATAIGRVLLKDEVVDTETDLARPSTQMVEEYSGATPVAVWAFVGSDEATEVDILTAGGGCIEFDSGGPAYYKHLARIQPESSARAAILATIPTAATLNAADGRQAALVIRDMGKAFGFGIYSDTGSTFVAQLMHPLTGTAVGSGAVLQRDTWYELGVRRLDTEVELLVNNVVVQVEDTATFPASTDHEIDFGNVSSGVAENPRLRVKRVWAGIETDTDYWAARRVDGAVATADPDRLTVGAVFFSPTDAGKMVRTYNSAVAKTEGGNNNGTWQAGSVADAQNIDLRGFTDDGADVDSANPARVVLPATAFRKLRYPDDLGNVLVLEDSAFGNEGPYIITKILQEGTLADYAGFDTVLEAESTICEVEVSLGTPASFVSELNLTWRIDPAFVTEAGLSLELSDAGSMLGTALTLRQALPAFAGGYEVVLAILATRIFTSQLLEDTSVRVVLTQDVPREYSHYPFYLILPLAYVRRYLDELTAAGIIAELVIV